MSTQPARVILIPSRPPEPAVRNLAAAPPGALKIDGIQPRPADTQADAEIILNRALQAWQDGDKARAALLCAEAAKADPGAWEPLYNQALLLEDDGKIDEAILLLRHACSVAQDEARPALRLAYLLEGTGREQEARYWYARSLEDDRSQSAGWLRLGMLEMKYGRWTEALPCLEQAFGAQPEAAYPLGLCNAMLGRLDEAVAALQEAPQEDPMVLLALAALALERDDPEAAEQCERTLRGQGQVNGALSYRLALAWQEREEHDLARIHYRRAVLADPALADGYFALQSHS
jgi:tetratricopeptide (TPR) repeat protein